MADIRINALPTTATDFASDDYIAIDGTTNGTRKLNAKTANLTFSDVTLGTSGPSAKSSIAARAARQGLVFDGTSGGTIANVATIGTADFTIAVWMNLRSTSGSQFILTNSIGTSNFQTSSADLVMYRSTGSVIATSTNPLVANKTQLIVYTRSGTTGQFYVNGVAFEGTKTDANNYTTFSDIGGVGSSSPCNGTLTPLIYNRALSASEVVALYEAGAPAGADYNTASNTSLVSTTQWVDNYGGFWSASGSVIFTGTTVTIPASNYVYKTFLSKGKKYRCVLAISSLSAGTVVVDDGVVTTYSTFTTTGTKTFEFTAAANGTFGVYLAGGNANIDSLLLYPLGLLLAPDAAQAGGGLTWYDTSGNNAFITLPASGVRWNVPSSQVLGGNWTTSGNLTVSGTGNSSFAGSIRLPWSTPSLLSYYDATYSLGFVFDSTNRKLVLRAQSADAPANGKGTIAFESGATPSEIARFAPSTGNFLLGTTTDSGNGKLQLADHTTSAGGIGFGTTTSLYRYGITTLGLKQNNGSYKPLFFYADVTNCGVFDTPAAEPNYSGIYFNSTANSATIATKGTVALTLDAYQNATFAGKTYTAAGAAATPAISFSGDTDSGFYNAGGNQVALACGGGQIWNTTVNGLSIAAGKDIYLGNAYVAGAPTATGYVTIKDSAGNTYKVLVGT